MAIVKGLDEQAVVWKYIMTVRQARRDPNHPWRTARDDNGNAIYDDITVYRLVRIYSRRARTNGAMINEELRPFLEKLKIRLLTSTSMRQGRRVIRYRAVGCEDIAVSEDVYNATPIHEVAQRYYDRIKNEDLVKLMDTDDEISLAVVNEMKEFINEIADTLNATEAIEMTDEEADETPREPNFYEYNYGIWV